MAASVKGDNPIPKVGEPIADPPPRMASLSIPVQQHDELTIHWTSDVTNETEAIPTRPRPRLSPLHRIGPPSQVVTTHHNQAIARLSNSADVRGEKLQEPTSPHERIRSTGAAFAEWIPSGQPHSRGCHGRLLPHDRNRQLHGSRR